MTKIRNDFDASSMEIDLIFLLLILQSQYCFGSSIDKKPRLVFLLLVASIFTTKIENFDAKADIGTFGEHSTIHSNFIELWMKVTGCPGNKCSCEVTVEKHQGITYPVEFYKEKPEIGRSLINELDPFTKYKFTLTCQGEQQTDKISSTKEFQTDRARPSAPENFVANVETHPVKLSWSPPKNLAGPIDFYRLWIDNTLVNENIAKDKTSYEMTSSGSTATGQRTLSLTACIGNLHNYTLCSSPEAAKVQVMFPTTTTTTTTTLSTGTPGTGPIPTVTTTTTTTPKSFAISSSSISVFTMFVALCFAFFRFER